MDSMDSVTAAAATTAVDSDTIMSSDPTSPADSSATDGIPDAAVVSLVDAVSHALDQPQAAAFTAPPPPLPTGWILKESRSQPNYYYYYHQETGISSWHSPVQEHQPVNDVRNSNSDTQQAAANDAPSDQQDMTGVLSGLSKVMDTAQDDNDNLPKKRSMNRIGSNDSSGNNKEPPTKKSKSAASAASRSSGGSKKPSKVRIFHILKKHKGSRRPSSWRQKVITNSKEEATEELQGLLEILQDEAPGPDQRATFEELARTESDCTSAKRGGDLGFFGPRKMQPAFEEASFALEIGQMSGIIETSSGVHVLLRIG